MPRINKPVVAHACIAASLIGTLAIARQDGGMPEMDERHPLAGLSVEDPAAAMQQYMESMEPGKPHSWLAQLVGDWDVTSKIVWDPAAPPMTSQASASYEMVLGNRFLKQNFNGNMMGMPFEGIGYTGFDKAGKMFTGVWMDSFGTGTASMRGSMSPDGSTLTMFGEMDEVMTGEYRKPVKFVIRIVDEDTHVFEAWEVAYGEPWMVMEHTYNRRK